MDMPNGPKVERNKEEARKRILDINILGFARSLVIKLQIVSRKLLTVFAKNWRSVDLRCWRVDEVYFSCQDKEDGCRVMVFWQWCYFSRRLNRWIFWTIPLRHLWPNESGQVSWGAVYFAIFTQDTSKRVETHFLKSKDGVKQASKILKALI